MYNVRDQAKIINDLVYYGGFSYEAAISMPVFERDFHVELINEKRANDLKFQMDIHGATKKR